MPRVWLGSALAAVVIAGAVVTLLASAPKAMVAAELDVVLEALFSEVLAALLAAMVAARASQSAATMAAPQLASGACQGSGGVVMGSRLAVAVPRPSRCNSAAVACLSRQASCIRRTSTATVSTPSRFASAAGSSKAPAMPAALKSRRASGAEPGPTVLANGDSRPAFVAWLDGKLVAPVRCAT